MGTYSDTHGAYFMTVDENYLCHHGIKGQKWGIRRYQNEDGSLTEAGKKRYHTSSDSSALTKAGVKKLLKEGQRLKKLEEDADLGTQAAISKKYRKKEAISHLTGGGGILPMHYRHVAKKAEKKMTAEGHKEAQEKYLAELDKAVNAFGGTYVHQAMNFDKKSFDRQMEKLGNLELKAIALQDKYDEHIRLERKYDAKQAQYARKAAREEKKTGAETEKYKKYAAKADNYAKASAAANVGKNFLIGKPLAEVESERDSYHKKIASNTVAREMMRNYYGYNDPDDTYYNKNWQVNNEKKKKRR